MTLKRNQLKKIFKLEILVPAGMLFVQFCMLNFREYPQKTLVKLIWITFNLGSCILITSSIESLKLKKIFINSVLSAIFFNAIIIIIDWYTIYQISGNPLIGYAQESYNFFKRPNSFYYEPSYVAAILSLGAFLPLSLIKKTNLSAFLTSLVLTSLFMTSSRMGYVQFAVACFFCFLFSKEKYLFLKKITLTVVFLFISIGLISLSESGKKFIEFQTGQLGVQETINRIKTDQEKSFTGELHSESNRIENTKNGLKIWLQAPILGNGFVMPKNLYKPLEPLTMNTWVEALSEFGLTGFIMLYSFLAFFYRRSKTNFAKSLIISHAIINLNFTQTMPRLDYWIFISAISLISSEFDL